MSNKRFLDATIALRTVGIGVSFMWQDKTADHQHDPRSIDTAYIIGTLRESVLDAPVYIAHVDGTEYSSFGYSYPVDTDVKVYLIESNANGNKYEPTVKEATDEEITEAKEHNREIACTDYAELMRLVSIGAYQERDHEGNWGEDGIEKRIWELDREAIENGEHFVPTSEGAKTYMLEPATQEELDAFQEALVMEEDEEE